MLGIKCGIILIVLGVVILIGYAWKNAHDRSREEAEQREAYEAAQRKAAEAKRERERIERERQEAAEMRKAQQAQKRREQKEKQAAAHAEKVARATELAEIEERRLQAKKELELLRRGIILPSMVEAAKSDGTPAVTLEQFAAKVKPGFFPAACMLAKKYKENVHALDGKSFTVTEKLDGVRCLARVDHSKVELYARSGKRIEGLTEIENALAALDVSAVFDGELLINGRGKLPSKEEYKKTCAIVRSIGKKTGIVYHVFDMVPLDVYTARGISAPYKDRRAALQRLNIISPIEIVPVLYSGRDTSQIETQLQAQRDAQHEGIMINLDDAPYSFSRCLSLLKYKVMNDCDLRIVDVNPGTGRNADTLGSFTVEYKGGTVRVGAGIPDTLRKAMWENPAEFIGRVVTVQYFEETQDRNGKKSLRFPAFKELREVGKTVSYA